MAVAVMRIGDPWSGGGRRESTTTVRYMQGWRNTEQDRKPAPRVARIISQDYEHIKRTCLAQQALWEDSSFSATDASLYPSHRGSPLPFKWKRPGEIVDDPRMFVDGFARFDVVQGELGNCWFLAATASLCATRDVDLFHRVIPLDNLFIRDYAGVFHFKLWQYGQWVDVVIDDRLPTLNGKLVFVHSSTHNEFWSALLEKAYAKLNGSYEALQGGSIAEAMEDFTSGVTETFNLQKGAPQDLFNIMRKAFERHSLLGCSIDVAPGQAMEGVLPNGLIIGHAYSITAVKQIQIGSRTVSLIRVRNPWGNEYEWKGSWADGSPEWRLLSESQKRDMVQADKDDGEFWMSYEDFMRNFTKLELCMMMPAYETLSLDAVTESRRTWKLSVQDGSWTRLVNAGGCRNNLDTFWTNPQYSVDVIDPDENDDENLGTLIIALMQKERRKKKQQQGIELLTIGYLVYKITADVSGPLDINFFKYNKSVAQSAFSNVREIVGRHKLVPGRYVIVPSTYRPNEEGDFLLRIFSEQKAPTTEMDEVTGLIQDTDGKVKTDVPILQNPDRPGDTRIKGHVKTDAEMIRMKAMVVTAEDVDEERELRELFRRTAGADLEVDPYELRHILDSKLKPEFSFQGVSLETARSMVAMKDVDHSGKLGYEEFKKLYNDLRNWKKVFHEYDRQNTSTLNSFELRAALNSAGFRVSNSTFKCLAMRYSDPYGEVSFDDFILCAIRLKTMFETFNTAATTSEQTAQFTLDEFIQTTMYS